jgi:hypothetical protein
MRETFKGDPSQLGAVLAISSVCLAVVLNVAIKTWHKNETKKHDTELKLEMISRGMSADEITRVLAANSADSTLAATTYHKKA